MLPRQHNPPEIRLAREQTYSNHRRWFPLFHFVVQPILVANVIFEIMDWSNDRTSENAWSAIVAIALLCLAFSARIMALKAQNRSIRLEEQLRLMRLMPAEEQHRIGELRFGHLIGLRFASDDEVVGLARRCLNGELRGAGDVKKEVKNWRPDHHRV
jgi:hypothetical protein